jgi:hypothetical protein
MTTIKNEAADIHMPAAFSSDTLPTFPCQQGKSNLVMILDNCRKVSEKCRYFQLF